MEVETQQHLTTLRQLLTYRMRELESERHAAAIERAESASEIDGAAVLDRKDEAEAEIREQAASRTSLRWWPVSCVFACRRCAPGAGIPSAWSSARA